MNIRSTSASVRLQAFWPEALPGPADVPRRGYGLSTLRNIMATWEERARLRWNLAQMAEAEPHLIDDIGLTTRQVEAEIAKPFWQS